MPTTIARDAERPDTGAAWFPSVTQRVLIVGGYGVFGGRLAQLLRREAGIEVLIAGRSLRRARAFCRRHGGTPLRFDRDRPLAPQLAEAKADVVVDAAGPFQHYGSDPYRLARAALEAGAHYLDLADDATFVAGIAELDESARAAQRTVLSGMSSVPAISSAAVEQLRQGLVHIEEIDTVILPGNRAPRGLSVVRAIVAQAGRPLTVWRGEVWQKIVAWGSSERVTLQAAARQLAPRLASAIGAPDLLLFPARYAARTVRFRAGLELAVLHRGLQALAWLPRLGLMRSLAGLARPLRFLADLFRPFGADRGGMRVTVVGEDAQHRTVSRRWTLIAEGGDGPYIPAIAAAAWLGARGHGPAPAPGARPAIGELSLPLIVAAMAPLDVVSEQVYEPAPSLFETALAADWPALPTPLRRLHGGRGVVEYHGTASIENGRHWFARAARLLMRLPAATSSTPALVRITADATREVWQRRFGTQRFRSTLQWSAKRRRIDELFAVFGLPMRFELGVRRVDDLLDWPVTRGWFCGVPLPRWLLPVTDAREFVDAEGRFCFDVSISLPGAGLVARYRGWLVGGAAP